MKQYSIVVTFEGSESKTVMDAFDNRKPLFSDSFKITDLSQGEYRLETNDYSDFYVAGMVGYKIEDDRVKSEEQKEAV